MTIILSPPMLSRCPGNRRPDASLTLCDRPRPGRGARPPICSPRLRVRGGSAAAHIRSLCAVDVRFGSTGSAFAGAPRTCGSMWRASPGDWHPTVQRIIGEGRHAAIWIEFADAGDHYPGLCLFDLDPCVVIGHDRLGATDAIGSACVTREARLGSFRDQVEGFVEAERHAFRVGLLELLLAEVGAHLAEAVVAVARLRRADAHFCGWGGVGGDYVCAQWSPGGCWLAALVAA